MTLIIRRTYISQSDSTPDWSIRVSDLRGYLTRGLDWCHFRFIEVKLLFFHNRNYSTLNLGGITKNDPKFHCVIFGVCWRNDSKKTKQTSLDDSYQIWCLFWRIVELKCSVTFYINDCILISIPLCLKHLALKVFRKWVKFHFRP